MAENQKKAIRIQIDMQYWVSEEEAQKVFEEDQSFFEELKTGFYSWENNKDDPRNPLNFELSTFMGSYKEEDDDKESP